MGFNLKKKRNSLDDFCCKTEFIRIFAHIEND